MGDGDDESHAKGWDILRWKWVREPPVEFVAVVYVALTIVCLLLLAVGVWGVVQFLSPIWTGKPTSSAVELGALRDRLIAIGALLTTPFLVWRVVVWHWAARAAQHQARIAQETARNTLFTKAIEQLGATREETVKVETRDSFGIITHSQETTRIRPNTEVRLGAIYALEKLAREDLQMHWPIMETLCAYVRENAGPAEEPDEEIAAIWAKPHVERTSEDRKQLKAYANALEPLVVDVQAALTVIGRRSNLQLNYERAQRIDAARDRRNAWRLDLRGAHLVLANLVGLQFEAALFDDSVLVFADARRVHLERASLRDTHLERIKLFEAHLEGASLDFAHLEGANLDRASLEGTSFFRATLAAAHLIGAHLEAATFISASLMGARLSEATLSDTFFNGVDISGTWGLSQEQLDVAFGDSKTKIPAELARPSTERWLTEEADEVARAAWSDLKIARQEYWRRETRKRRKNALQN